MQDCLVLQDVKITLKEIKKDSEILLQKNLNHMINKSVSMSKSLIKMNHIGHLKKNLEENFWKNENF